jgi:hypothetical protein
VGEFGAVTSEPTSDANPSREQRFMQAYSIAKEVLRDLGIFPAKGNGEQERLAMEIDEFERGYPRLTLSMMMDVVAACLKAVESKKEKGSETDTRAEFIPWTREFAHEIRLLCCLS